MAVVVGVGFALGGLVGLLANEPPGVLLAAGIGAQATMFALYLYSCVLLGAWATAARLALVAACSDRAYGRRPDLGG
ncbi:hypothetical protein ACFSTC_00755 [Nonomuraea ferruginea]